MSRRAAAKGASVRSFRTKLLVAMMLVVGAMTVLGLFLAQRKVQIEATFDLQQDFRNELATVHGVQEVRRAALAERCGLLVERPRLHAALEDNALDLLYPSARDELRDVVQGGDSGAPLNARFYRFLDQTGAVMSPPNDAEVGQLNAEEEAQVALHGLPDDQQIGYLVRDRGDTSAVDEIIAMPINSTETGEVIAALVFGFKPVEFGAEHTASDIKSGIWLEGQLHLPGVTQTDRNILGAHLERLIAGQRGVAQVSNLQGSELETRAPTNDPRDSSAEVRIGGVPHLLFSRQLNPGSMFPPAYEVAVYSLAEAIARQQQIRWHVLIAGSALLLIGLIASHLLSSRLSAPVERLAVTSEQNREQRARAEAALESTSVELQRSARFSADASHQLKTPVTVLRAGIEELLARDDFSPEVYHELSALLHHTYRITSVIDDLLLLSRMDAGRLQIQFDTVNLSQLLAEWIDDLSALPDEFELKVDTNFPAGLHVFGEKRYITLIVQNLLENARKYNRPNGQICVAVEEDGDFAVLTVENTGKPIPPAARQHIFERFHRGGMGENVPGHGLGLNLARELARLHGGDLRLIRSDEEWTEFEVRFRLARSAVLAAAQPA